MIVVGVLGLGFYIESLGFGGYSRMEDVVSLGVYLLDLYGSRPKAMADSMFFCTFRCLQKTSKSRGFRA